MPLSPALYAWPFRCSVAPTAPPARESCCVKVSPTRPARRLSRDTLHFAPTQAQEAAPGYVCTGYARGESPRSVTRGKMRIAKPCSLYSPLVVELFMTRYYYHALCSINQRHPVEDRSGAHPKLGSMILLIALLNSTWTRMHVHLLGERNRSRQVLRGDRLSS